MLKINQAVKIYFYTSLIQKTADISDTVSEYELMIIIIQTFTQSMFQVNLFCSRSIFENNKIGIIK